MATKRPLVVDTTTGQVRESVPPDQIPADILPPVTGTKTFAFFAG